MPIEFKKFEYGETRTATVLTVTQCQYRTQTSLIDTLLIELKDGVGEKHFLLGVACSPRPVPGDSGIITFTKGGPMGGYWNFEKGKTK